MAFVAVAATSLLTSVGVGAVVAGAIGGVVANILTSVALSALSAALAPDAPEQVDPGIQTRVTLSGGDNSRRFVMGRYAVGGTYVCPPMSRGVVNGTPNAYCSFIYVLSDKAGVTLNRVIIDGQYVAITGTVHPSHGNELGGRYAGKGWVRLIQNPTAVDATLLGFFGGRSQRKWLNDMIGRGLTIAVLTIRYAPKIWGGTPSVLFECDGIKFYDPRLDTTVGGSGSHRWANEATWAQTDNPMVMAYNIHRGVTFEDGKKWGGVAQAGNLPLSNWFAAMNACDASVALAAGGTEPRYRAGFEVSVDMEPATVLDELYKAAAARPVEIAGQFKVRVGAAGLPVAFITDDDILVSREQVATPHPGLSDTYNAVYATHPSPGQLWEPNDLPPRINAAAVTAAQGRVLPVTLSFSAVPYKRQCQRLMKSALADHQRMLRHAAGLGPAAAVIEPLETLGYTSTRYQYATKLFEVGSVEDDWRSLCQGLLMREVDPSDYDWVAATDEVAEDDGDGTIQDAAAQTVPGFAVVAQTIVDAGGSARRLQIKATFIAADLDDVTAVEWEIRLLGTVIVFRRGQVTNVAAAEFLITSGLLPVTSYEVRARLVATGRDTDWTGWTAVTTAVLFLDDRDVGLPDIPNNLILNGRFKFGDLRYWEDIAAGFSVIPKAGGGNAQILACPTEFMMKMAFSLTSKEAFSKRFSVDPSDRIQITYRSAASLTTSLGPVPVLVLGLEMYRADGTPIGSLFTGGINPSTWQYRTVEYSNFDPECVSVRARVQYVMTAGAPSNLDIYMTNLMVSRKTTSTDSNYTPGAQNIGVAFTQMASVTNSNDQEAADNATYVDFSCVCRFQPPASETQMTCSFELRGPNGFVRSLTSITARNWNGTTALINIPVSFSAVIPASSVLPEVFSVWAMKGTTGYVVDAGHASLILQTAKR